MNNFIVAGYVQNSFWSRFSKPEFHTFWDQIKLKIGNRLDSPTKSNKTMYTHLQTTLIFWEVVGGLNTLAFREYISRSLMSGIALYYDIHTHIIWMKVFQVLNFLWLLFQFEWCNLKYLFNWGGTFWLHLFWNGLCFDIPISYYCFCWKGSSVWFDDSILMTFWCYNNVPYLHCCDDSVCFS